MLPDSVFDREREWADLREFATGRASGPRLGIIHGRRRQGKSYLLRALADETGGIYHQALEEESAPALKRLGATIAADAGLSGAVAYSDWDAALRALTERAGSDRVVVLDEIPYLLAQSPEIPSAIQAIFDDARSGRHPAFRMLLCGSAVSVMALLLSGQQALRGRASLELPLRPFDFRQAARFWGLSDPESAFLVHSVVGGTPGYRALLDMSPPTHVADFAGWLAGGVLNPSHAMFREADYLLTEDPGMTDRALYQSVLAAIAEGHTTRNAIGSLLQRNDAALRHPLLVLERAGLIRRDADQFLAKRPLLRLEDPFLRFSFAVIRPELVRLESRQTADAWDAAQPSFESRVLGPHFEQLARAWTAEFAGDETLGGRPASVGFTQLNDASGRSRLEIDVVALAGGPQGRRSVVLAIGEAKGGPAVRGLGDLRRLERARALLAERANVRRTKLLLFARSGFALDLIREAGSRPDIELIDLARLYSGT